jgi:4'-phosphopantetheinyl transferase
VCWRIPVEAAGGALAARLEALLDPSERARMARFLMAADRRRFLAAHAGLRILLGAALACAPASLTFVANPYGKPALPERELEFSLSHSGAVALVGLTAGAEIGIDVEQIRPIEERESLAARYFHPSEAAALALLDDAQREIGFFRTWTRKEAYVKALGLGLSMDLASFSVASAPESWSLLDLDPEPGHVGAIALPQRPVLTVRRTLELGGALI